MIQVNRFFRDLVRNSAILQRRCELFAAGLIENPRNSYDPTEHSKLLEFYAHKWSAGATIVKNTRVFPLNITINSWVAIRTLSKDLLGSALGPDGALEFLHIPLSAGQEAVEVWNIPAFPFEAMDFAVYHPDNLLAVAEHKGRWVGVFHFARWCLIHCRLPVARFASTFLPFWMALLVAVCHPTSLRGRLRSVRFQ